MKLPRKRLVAAIAGLALYSTLAVASLGGPVVAPATIGNILRAVQLAQGLMKTAKLLSASTSTSLNEAYSDLGQRLRDGDFSTESIQQMEETHARLRAQADTLNWTLTVTRSSANELFGMLERRAEENSTPDLQKLMETDIREKQRQFNEQLAIADQAMSRINASIKQYDDILGFVQVNAGLHQVDQYLAQIDQVLSQAAVLDRELQAAIDGGMQIVETYNTGG
jgi:hypothetical protein